MHSVLPILIEVQIPFGLGSPKVTTIVSTLIRSFAISVLTQCKLLVLCAKLGQSFCCGRLYNVSSHVESSVLYIYPMSQITWTAGSTHTSALCGQCVVCVGFVLLLPGLHWGRILYCRNWGSVPGRPSHRPCLL